MKVPDAVIKVKDLDLIEFMDNVQTILNNGLYEMRIFGAVPDFQANDGETGILVNGDVRQLYFFLDGVWSFIGFNALGTMILFDKDGDTGITPEFTFNEDVIRFYTAGTYKFGMGTWGMGMASNTPIYFDGAPGTSYWIYDTTTNYLTAYLGGEKRLEL